MSQQQMPIVSIVAPGVPEVPGFTSMSDGYLLDLFFGDSTPVDGQFIFALISNSLGVPLERKVLAKHDTNITPTSAATLENTKNDVDYEAPTGKETRFVIRIQAGTTNTTPNIKIRASDSADTDDGTILETLTPTAFASGNKITTKILTLPAEKFLTVKNDSATGNIQARAWLAEEI